MGAAAILSGLVLAACAAPSPPTPTRPAAVTPNIPPPVPATQVDPAAEEAVRTFATAIAMPTQPPATRSITAPIDGRLLLATTRTGPRARSDFPLDYRLASISRAGFESMAVEGDQLGLTNAAASPDGRTVYVVVGGRRILALENGRARDAVPQLPGISVDRPAGYLSATPLGSGALLVQQSGGGGLASFDLASGASRKLPGTGLDPSVAPDGQRLALGYVTDQPYYSIYVTDLSFTNPRKLTGDRVLEMAAAWSPDGQWIAYAANAGFEDQPSPTQAWELRVIRPDGSDPRTLLPRANGVTISRLAWSPDSRFVAFTRSQQNGSTRQVSVIPLAGGTEIPISSGDANDKALAWLP